MLNRSSLVFQGVGNGEYPLGISLEYAGLWADRRRAGEDDLSGRRHPPLDGRRRHHQGRANPEAAKTFVDYINRKDICEMILKATFRRPAGGPRSYQLPGRTCRRSSSLKLITYDEEGWTRSATDAGEDQGPDPGDALKEEALRYGAGFGA